MESQRPQFVPFNISVLRSCASGLFGIFLVSVILRSLPPRPLDPLWQVSFTTTLLDMGGYALLGVVVLTIAHLIDPLDARLNRRMNGVNRSCRWAALGYLLLVPLLITALMRDYLQVEQFGLRQQKLVRLEDVQLRKAIQSAKNREQLMLAVQRFNAPALDGLIREQAPLEASRSQALELLRLTTESRTQATKVSPASRRAIVINNLRLILLALVFAYAFSSAHTGFPSLPLLVPFLKWAMRS